MHMGARRWRMGSGIPGYSGPALPRATRSARARAAVSRKVAAGLSFDWLAEVAGEILQGGGEQKKQQEMSQEDGKENCCGGAAESGKGVEEGAIPCVEDKFIVKDGKSQKQEDMKSDNESGTSFAEAEDSKQKLNIQCQINQASHEEEMKEKAAAEAAANAANADEKVVMEVEDKPVIHVLPVSPAVDAGQSGKCTKVKDEECSSECIMSEEGMEKPPKNRRSRKRKLSSKACSWGSQSKRNKHVEFQSAKASSAPTSPAARKPGDGNVKVSVKSFTIPELYVDIPESATVGTLKRAVMDAAMNLLGGGLRVCVLLQGRKVPDEAATLSQMGISHGGKSDLGFMLEPTTITPSTSNHDDPLLVLLHAANQPSPRCPAYVMPVNMEGGWNHPNNNNNPAADQQFYAQQPDMANKMPASTVQCAETGQWEHINNNNLGSPHSGAVAAPAIKPQTDNDEQTKNESDSTSTLSQATPCKPRVFDAKAIILHPAMGGVGVENGQGMALVPMRPKNHTLEIHKRRIRRPFSVGEVESLVQAVEQLGTGRWRDVKLQAFENAKHRTYVDLKDKWKTLVHTAQIAPHQRRGDPVPQELLDRVIAANNYWAAHQAKEQAELDA